MVSSHCSAIRLSTLEGHTRAHFFGFVGANSEEANTIEIGYELGRLLHLEDEMLVTAQIEYSYEKLPQVELEPLTVEDFEVIE